MTHADATLRLIKKNGLSKEGYELTIDKKEYRFLHLRIKGYFTGYKQYNSCIF
ncbi:hypothetical protein KUH03_29120 [Sphingobacterium sp. E70]|uniref:hypothetical protein n=1 Tax=Sphingobacterium sp. E70 TaxID=2853439 RepID=UPI00211CFB93|nr:hypothetical protein [Sphingobacterium sp. E70]ULT23244.1 hypothetical protein KUH03_29120 [Sphingobacterium sp. E70]